MHIYASTHDGTSPIDICAKESIFLIRSLGKKISPRCHSYKCPAIFWISSAVSASHQYSFCKSALCCFIRYPVPLSHLWSISSCPSKFIHSVPPPSRPPVGFPSQHRLLPGSPSQVFSILYGWKRMAWVPMHTWQLLSVTWLSNNP